MITLEQLKLALKLNDNEDDDELQRKLTAATYECAKFLNIPYDAANPVLGSPLDSPDVINGIVLMVQADYDIDPVLRSRIRDAAIAIWYPYRQVWSI